MENTNGQARIDALLDEVKEKYGETSQQITGGKHPMFPFNAVERTLVVQHSNKVKNKDVVFENEKENTVIRPYVNASKIDADALVFGLIFPKNVPEHYVCGGIGSTGVGSKPKKQKIEAVKIGNLSFSSERDYVEFRKDWFKYKGERNADWRANMENLYRYACGQNVDNQMMSFTKKRWFEKIKSQRDGVREMRWGGEIPLFREIDRLHKEDLSAGKITERDPGKETVEKVMYANAHIRMGAAEVFEKPVEFGESSHSKQAKQGGRS